MALPLEFSLLNSELNDFLFAEIGEEESGAPLSVLSALTRLGADPWAEGTRLSRLPKGDAARALATLIARLPENNGKAADVLTLAERLAALLPKNNAGRAPSAVRRSHRRVGRPALWFVVIVLFALLVAAYELLPGQ